MKISCCQFLFHPFHEEQSKVSTVLSVITNIALAAITAGLYLFIFVGVHLSERYAVQEKPLQQAFKVPPPSFPSRDQFVGVEALKEKPKESLGKIKRACVFWAVAASSGAH